MGVVEDGAGDTCAVGGRVADFASLQDGELRGYSPNCVLGVWAGAGDEMERTCSFSIESKVFGKGLCDAKFEALVDEVADGPGVVFEISRSETLVCAIEEGEVVPGSEDFCELGPLGAGGVYAGGVVGARVEEDDASFGGLFDGGTHAFEVEAFGLGGEVGVGFYGEVDVGEDLVVVGPCWGGEVDGLIIGTLEEFGEEEGAEVDGAGARDGLKAGDLRVMSVTGGNRSRRSSDIPVYLELQGCYHLAQAFVLLK